MRYVLYHGQYDQQQAYKVCQAVGTDKPFVVVIDEAICRQDHIRDHEQERTDAHHNELCPGQEERHGQSCDPVSQNRRKIPGHWPAHLPHSDLLRILRAQGDEQTKDQGDDQEHPPEIPEGQAMIDHDDLIIDRETDVARKEEISSPAKVEHQKQIAEIRKQESHHVQALIRHEIVFPEESYDRQHKVHGRHDVFVYGAMHLVI